MSDTRGIQDHAIDETTDVNPQHFDDDGYVIGHPHHLDVTDQDLGPDGRLIDDAVTEGAPETDLTTETDEPDAPDGQFDSQDMPTADGEPAEPESDVVVVDIATVDIEPVDDETAVVLDDEEASIAPPPETPEEPGDPAGPGITPPEPGPPTPDEPAPFTPDAPDEHGGQPPLLGDRAF